MPLTQVKTSNLDTTNSLFFRNRIINGDMRIAQRATSVASAGGGGGVYSTVDRFAFYLSSAAVVSEAQVTDAPTGFTNSVKYTVTTADTSVAAGDYILPFQRIEGNNIADLSWGTASAKTVTLSFWVKSSKTGIYYAGFRNGSFGRSYAAPYTINSANTWEYKTITVPGDTTGTWTTDNSEGLGVFWWLMGGSDFNASSISTWVSANTTKFSNQVNWADAVGATFQITGVQLEAGTAATAFERRPYTTELQLCQRYYCKSYQQSVAPGTSTTLGVTGVHASTTSLLVGGFNTWPVTMRTTPTVTIYSQIGTTGKLSAPGATDTGTSVISETPSEKGAVGINSSGGFTLGAWYYGHFVATAEL